jgi:ribosomal protein L30/L7E
MKKRRNHCVLHSIQDELISAMGNKIKTVPGMLKKTKYYLVLFGLVHDMSSGATVCS